MEAKPILIVRHGLENNDQVIKDLNNISSNYEVLVIFEEGLGNTFLFEHPINNQYFANSTKTKNDRWIQLNGNEPAEVVAAALAANKLMIKGVERISNGWWYSYDEPFTTFSKIPNPGYSDWTIQSTHLSELQ